MKLNESCSVEVTILLPCLNEAAAVGPCVDEAQRFLMESGRTGEVLVVDNGSDDDSASIAAAHGARVVMEPRRGYGRALRTGLSHSRGAVVVLSDCDGTYDLLHLEGLVRPLLEGGCDLVVGDRFAGGLEPGAMSALHRLGVPVLSALGRLRFHTSVRDFHSGQRALTREAIARLKLRCDGMEFATELIAQAAGQRLRIAQTPIVLRRCPFERRSKLRTFSDGVRHLRYILFPG